MPGLISMIREPEKNSRSVKLSSRELAALIVDALVDGGFINADAFENAVEIAKEEIEIRKAGGDY